MGHKITKPAQKLYWIAKNGDGDVIHVGELNTNQELVTPQDTLVSYTTKIGQIEDIETFAGPQPAFNYNYDEIRQVWEFIPEEVVYLPVATHMASGLNNALYQCIKPEGTGNYAVEVPHQTWPNYVMFKLNRYDKVPIDLGVDATPLQDALAIAVNDSGITQAEADQVVADVQASAGQEVDLIDFVPDSWVPYILTEQDAISLGYLIDEEGV